MLAWPIPCLSRPCARLFLVALIVAVAGCTSEITHPGAEDGSDSPDPVGPGGDLDGDPDVDSRCSDADRWLRFGLNVDPHNPNGNPAPEQLVELGVRWVRIEWKLGTDLAQQDAVIASMRGAGIRVLLIVDYASAAGFPGEGGSDQAWRAFVTDSFVPQVSHLARTYRDDIDAWEIWNEPDLPFSWVPPAIFGEMLRDSRAAIRAHSVRPVIVGGLASGNLEYLQAAIDAVGELPADAIGVHPYGQAAPDDWPHPGWGFGNMSTLLDAYLNRFSVPLWLTEAGNDSLDPDRQGQYLRHVYQLAQSGYGDRVPVVLWFCWSDGMVSPFGLVGNDGAPKPAFSAYQSISPPWRAECEGAL